MGQLTRAEMEAVIAEGGSVLHNNYTHTSVATLPSPADLALGDVEAENAADAAIEEQMRSLLAQRTKLANEREMRAKRQKQANRAKLEEMRAAAKARGEEPPKELPEGEEEGDGAGGDFPITELPDQGDRISEEEREEEHEKASGEGDAPENEPQRPPEREGEGAPSQPQGSSRRAAGDGDEGPKGKEAAKPRK